MTGDDVLEILAVLAGFDVWFGADGSAVQASLEPGKPFVYPAECFVTGSIGGEPVRCLSAAQQVYFHQGYEPADHDRHDMAVLREAFGVATHF